MCSHQKYLSGKSYEMGHFGQSKVVDNHEGRDVLVASLASGSFIALTRRTSACCPTDRGNK